MRSLRLVAAIPLVVGLLLTAATPVLAACDPGRANVGFAGFAGTQGNLTGVQGVHATIEEYKPFVSSGSVSLMWVMLNSGVSKWSQIGWWHESPSSHRVFEQHTNATGTIYTNYWPDQGGSSNDYKVIASSSSPTLLTWKFYVNGALRSTATRLFTPTTYQLYGETHNKRDQMSGGFTNLKSKATFVGAQKQNVSGTWSAVTTAAGVNDSTMFGAQLSSGTYYIWDKACAS